MIRLVATDLDGTLLRSDGTVSPYTRSVLAEVETRGVPVVFVTARPLRWMTELLPLVGRHGLAIVSNGAAVYDVTAGTVRDITPIDRAVGLTILAEVAAAIPGVGLGIERLPSGMVRTPGYVADDGAHGVPDEYLEGDLADHWTEPVVKLLVRSTELDPADLRSRTGDIVGDRATATWSTPGLVEIGPVGVSKASRLAEVAAALGVDRADVAAFGDMPNDIPMLELAGHPYAVANAHPDLLERFPIVGSNDSDGVAVALADLILR